MFRKIYLPRVLPVEIFVSAIFFPHSFLCFFLLCFVLYLGQEGKLKGFNCARTDFKRGMATQPVDQQQRGKEQALNVLFASKNNKKENEKKIQNLEQKYTHIKICIELEEIKSHVSSLHGVDHCVYKYVARLTFGIYILQPISISKFHLKNQKSSTPGIMHAPHPIFLFLFKKSHQTTLFLFRLLLFFRRILTSIARGGR